jgi:SAM-dependent methyltransferase
MNIAQTRPALLLRHFLRSIDRYGPRAAIGEVYQRLQRSFSSHGLSGTLRRTVRNDSSAPGVAEPIPIPLHPFDTLHGVDTGGAISSASLPLSVSGTYANSYLGIPPSALTQAISHLPLKPEDFTFVDVGCGKGRALFVAAQFPFRHLLGVELSPELCRVARANTDTNPDWAARITIVNQDAATVAYPDTPLVLFFYDPFLASALRRVLVNLERQLRRSPREAYLLYSFNPRFTKVMNRFPFLCEIRDTTYPLSAEDIAADCMAITQQPFTLYQADLTR